METDVVVIGGGVTGTGVAWDLTLRGLRVTLVEMGDVGTGTSGRYASIRHQTGKPTQKPTLRWVFQLFQAVHLLSGDGAEQVSNLTEERGSILVSWDKDAKATTCCVEKERL